MSSIPITTIPPVNKKVFFILWTMSILGFLAVIPYSYSIAGKTLDLQEFLNLKAISSIIFTLLLFGLLILMGLYIARRIGLGLPILTGLVSKEDVSEKIKAMFLPTLLIGVLGGVIVILLDSLFFGPLLAEEMRLLGLSQAVSVNPPAWQGLLASIEGGINEEVQLRLFFMTLIAGLIALATRKMDRKLPAGIFWAANILAAVLFGLGHLPTMKLMGFPMDLLVVSRAIVLNGLLGIGFGWLYWKHGLESAMLSHFSADIILHVIFPLILSLSMIR